MSEMKENRFRRIAGRESTKLSICLSCKGYETHIHGRKGERPIMKQSWSIPLYPKHNHSDSKSEKGIQNE